MSAFDKIYRSALPMKFFTKGWGKPDTLIRLIENINIISNREKFLTVLDEHPPITIEKRTEHKNVLLIEGSFRSPFCKALPHIMEPENETARFQLVLPKEWTSKYKPICLHFAGTGDHTYSRRRFLLANGLLADGVGSIIIMNPFYWKRKPKDQRGSSLNYVSDLFVMGGALILECSTILNWCELNGYGPLALHGISMGGYMASLCATVWPKPISLIPCLSWTTASVVFVDGILGAAVDWKSLTKQYFSDAVYSDRVRPLIQPSIPEHYRYSSNPKRNNRDPFVSHENLPDDVPVLSHLKPMLASANHGKSNQVTTRSSTSSTMLDVLSTSSDSSSHSTDPGISRTAAAILSGLPKNSFLFGLTPSKHFQLKQALSSWSVFSRPSDNSLWHNGLSILRSWPDTLGMGSTPPDPEVSQFLRELLDYFTHLGNFSPVVDPRLILAVAAEQDAYVPREGVIPLNELYSGCDVRLLAHAGHVGAYLRNAVWTKDFRHAITDCLNRQVELHYGEPGPFGLPHTKSSSSHPTIRRRH